MTSIDRKLLDDKISLPSPLIHMMHGCPLYTIPDLAKEIDNYYLGQFDITYLATKYTEQVPFCSLHKKSPWQLNILSGRHMTDGVTFCSGSNGGLTINLSGGRVILSNKDYIQKASRENFEVIISMADEVPFHTSKKKNQHSYERTMRWFLELRSSPLIDWNSTKIFGVAVGGLEPEKIALMAQTLLKEGAHGVVIGGAGMGETLEERQAALIAVRTAVGPNVPILIQGMRTITDIVDALRHGADLIGSDYPKTLSDSGRAALWWADAWNSMQKNDADLSNLTPDEESVIEGGCVQSVYKKAKCEPAHYVQQEHAQLALSSSSQSEDDCDSSATNKPDSRRLINLWDEKFRKDPRPMMPGCACHACRSHSRAYIHHLLRAKELLSEVLIYTHNQHQLFSLFKVIKNKWVSVPSNYLSISRSANVSVASAVTEVGISMIESNQEDIQCSMISISRETYMQSIEE